MYCWVLYHVDKYSQPIPTHILKTDVINFNFLLSDFQGTLVYYCQRARGQPILRKNEKLIKSSHLEPQSIYNILTPKDWNSPFEERTFQIPRNAVLWLQNCINWNQIFLEICIIVTYEWVKQILRTHTMHTLTSYHHITSYHAKVFLNVSERVVFTSILS